MISFYPGPSRVHDAIPTYVKAGFREGILSVNHRSEEFMKISRRTVELLREKLNIPRNYGILFTSSATECWEIIAQSCIKTKSYHFYNGAFGEKWFTYTQRLRPSAKGVPFSMDEKPDATKWGTIKENSVLCFTQNETSNGTQVPISFLRSIKKSNPTCLVAVDATSSMAGISLDFSAGDIWFASVQKCFGLPAGLGIFICSPKAIRQTQEIGERKHYNSLLFNLDMMALFQTPYTPNVLGIYLLMRVLENSKSIDKVHKKIVDRYEKWIDFLSQRKTITPLVTNQAVRSYTVIPLTATAEITMAIKAGAKKEGILLGEGYGKWKANTFRIANFPALKKKEIQKLMRFLSKF